MELEDLGYTIKWVEFGLIDEDVLNLQFGEFLKGEDQNTEHYRYGTFLHWLRSKKELTDLEINNYIELAIEDPNEFMAGSAMKELLTAPQITEKQFELVKSKLPQFGDWTKKLINRETLKKRILSEALTGELFEKCVKHAKEFKENALVELIIHKTNEMIFLSELSTNNYGKRIRNMANEKIKRIKKAGNG